MDDATRAATADASTTDASSATSAEGGTAPRVTVVCSPRDHYGHAEMALESLLERTTEPHDLIYVIGRAPTDVLAHVRRRSSEAGFRLIERDKWLVPNHARNLAMAHVHTEYVAFVENDTVVAEGWLEALIECADDTGAAMVAPLQFIGPLERYAIHVAGGYIHLDESRRPRPMRLEHRHQGLYPSEVPTPLERTECDYAEYHCQLVRTEILDEIGPLDEHLLSVREVEDEAFLIRAAGGSIWFEPTARATFMPPEELTRTDMAFISHRWGERANRQSFEYFCAKHDLDRGHIDDKIGFANQVLRQGMLFAGFRRPVRKVLSKVGLARVESALALSLFAVERLLNRLLIRPGPTTL